MCVKNLAFKHLDSRGKGCEDARKIAVPGEDKNWAGRQLALQDSHWGRKSSELEGSDEESGSGDT